MHLDMKAFLLTGQFEPVTFGLTRQQLVAILGEPDDWGGHKKMHKAPVWLYGSFEFYFPKYGDGITTIFSDHLDPFKGSANLRLDPWILSADLSLPKAETILNSEAIVYDRHELPELNASELTTASGVVLRFDTVDERTDRMFTAFWLRHDSLAGHM
jgi:hypothetical protein